MAARANACLQKARQTGPLTRNGLLKARSSPPNHTQNDVDSRVHEGHAARAPEWSANRPRQTGAGRGRLPRPVDAASGATEKRLRADATRGRPPFDQRENLSSALGALLTIGLRPARRQSVRFGSFNRPERRAVRGPCTRDDRLRDSNARMPATGCRYASCAVTLTSQMARGTVHATLPGLCFPHLGQFWRPVYPAAGSALPTLTNHCDADEGDVGFDESSPLVLLTNTLGVRRSDRGSAVTARVYIRSRTEQIAFNWPACPSRLLRGLTPQSKLPTPFPAAADTAAPSPQGQPNPNAAASTISRCRCTRSGCILLGWGADI